MFRRTVRRCVRLSPSGGHTLDIPRTYSGQTPDTSMDTGHNRGPSGGQYRRVNITYKPPFEVVWAWLIILRHQRHHKVSVGENRIKIIPISSGDTGGAAFAPLPRFALQTSGRRSRVNRTIWLFKAKYLYNNSTKKYHTWSFSKCSRDKIKCTNTHKRLESLCRK